MLHLWLYQLYQVASLAITFPYLSLDFWIFLVHIFPPPYFVLRHCAEVGGLAGHLNWSLSGDGNPGDSAVFQVKQSQQKLLLRCLHILCLIFCGRRCCKRPREKMKWGTLMKKWRKLTKTDENWWRERTTDENLWKLMKPDETWWNDENWWNLMKTVEEIVALPCASPAWPIRTTTTASAKSPLHPSCPKQLVVQSSALCYRMLQRHFRCRFNRFQQISTDSVLLCTVDQLTISWPSVDHQLTISWPQWSRCMAFVLRVRAQKSPSSSNWWTRSQINQWRGRKRKCSTFNTCQEMARDVQKI